MTFFQGASEIIVYLSLLSFTTTTDARKLPNFASLIYED